MDRIIAYEGGLYIVAFARARGGESPGANFFNALSLQDKAKLTNVFRLVADHGSCANNEKFGVLDKGLYEFKSFKIRMPWAYARERRLILISHGFFKKRDRAPREEIDRAWRILKRRSRAGQ